MLAGRGDGADGRRAEQRMAGRRRECREPNADAWLLVRVRIAGSRTNGRQDPLGAVRHAERKLEIQLGARRRPATDGLFPRRLQRQRLERHARAGTLGAERIRRSGLPQRRLRLAGLVQKRSAARSRRAEPRGFLPPYGRHPRGMGRQADRRAFRLGDVEHLPLGQRPLCGLQRGQQAGGRVRPDALRETRPESHRVPGLPLVRRHIPRRSGLLPPFGRGPRLLPLRARQTANYGHSGRRRAFGRLHRGNGSRQSLLPQAGAGMQRRTGAHRRPRAQRRVAAAARHERRGALHARRRESRPVERRDARAIRTDGDAPRAGGRSDRGHSAPDRIPRREDRGRAAARQRPAGADQGRQPA